MPSTTAAIRFGVFVFDLRAGELHKNGGRIRLQRQPAQLLAILLEHPGEVVTREELRQRLWTDQTFVDFEHGLNGAVKRLREALGDSAENPIFVETLPRCGYRFIAPAEAAVTSRPEAQSSEITTPQNAVVHRSKSLSTRTVVVLALVLVFLVAASVLGYKRWQSRSAAAPVTIRSIAVLPLQDVSHADKEYFSDGMTEALITELAKIRALRVISHQSVMKYKNSSKPLPEIAKELNVDGAIEGSVLLDRGQVRISVQLIGANPERHLWAESYERDGRDIISLQQEVARDIATRIKVTVSPQEHVSGGGTRSLNPQTYMLYLQARYFQQRLTPENLAKAVDCYEQVIRLDPDYAPAWAGLAVAQALNTQNHTERGTVATLEGYRQARQTAERALALDPNLAEAHVALARVDLISEWGWVEADASMQRALTLAPGDAAVLEGAAELACVLGRFEESLRLARQAVRVDPLNPAAFTGYGLVAYYAGQLEEAASAEKKALDLNPDDPFAHRLLAKVYLMQSRLQEALSETAKDKERGSRLLLQALTYHALGRKRESDTALAGLIATAQEGWFYQVAEVYAFRGESDQAFQWLERAYAERDGGLASIKGDPLLKSLESDPRYAAFLKKMPLPLN